MELAQVEDCQKRKTNKAPVAADKLHYLSLHDSGTLPQMNGAQSLKWMGWLKIEMLWKVFWTPLSTLFVETQPVRKNTHTLDEATSSDCACGVLASLDHPKSSVRTGSDRHSLLATALVEFWSRWTTLNLAFFSVQPQRKHKMILGSVIPVAPLEHSLPVASVLRVPNSLPVASVLRVPNSLPVASVLRVPNSLPVASVLRVPNSLPLASVLRVPNSLPLASVLRVPINSLPLASVLRVPNSLPVASVLRVPNSLSVASVLRVPNSLSVARVKGDPIHYR